LLILSASILDLLLPARRLRQPHVVGAFDDEIRNARAELLCELIARGRGVLDRVMQPSRGHELGVGTIRHLREQVRDLGEVIDIRLIASPLARHAAVTARG
jgi:hypothetical protein